MKTGMTIETISESGTNADENIYSDRASNDEKMTNFTKALENDPLLLGINNLFDELHEEYQKRCKDRISFLEA
jgi:hypothetical protein